MVRNVLPVLLLLAFTGCTRLIAPSDLRPAPHPLLDVAPGHHTGATATANPWRERPAERQGPAPLATQPVATATRLPVRPAGPRPAEPAVAQPVTLPEPARPTPAAPLTARRARPAGLPAPAGPRPATALVQPRAPRTVLAGIRRAGVQPAQHRPPQPAPLLPAPSRVRDPQVLEARRQVSRRLASLTGQRSLDRRAATELALVRHALGGLGTRVDGVDAVDDLWEVSAPQRQAPEPGDLMFFKPTPTVPKVCVVRQRLHGGVIEASCVTRGQVRTVRVAPGHPNLRRQGGRIINTFLRTKHPNDPPRARYLAGQLLWQIRTPFR